MRSGPTAIVSIRAPGGISTAAPEKLSGAGDASLRGFAIRPAMVAASTAMPATIITPMTMTTTLRARIVGTLL